jgi:DNA-binding NtrC family response regulator
MGSETTSQVEPQHEGPTARAVPGLLLVFAAGRPQLAAFPVEPKLELGRDALAALGLEDKRLSRKHAELSAAPGGLLVRDLDSRNGTFIAGERLRGERLVSPGTVLRLGDTLFLASDDVAPYRNASVEVADNTVLGPRLSLVWSEIAQAAKTGDSLHLQGETGSGKELAARHFHQASGRAAGPFVAVNCATIPPAIAERLLFGARKGAYSGADADTDGYLQAADGGTLFLDEIAELSLEVQAKLLRVIETRQVLPLGATRPRTVDLRLVSATHRDLRQEAAATRFREDLYYRIGRPSVALPPLRERREDVPWLMRWMLAREPSPLKLSPSFVEEVMDRAWPGNVRELRIELAAASSAARAASSDTLEARHLGDSAGQPLEVDTGDTPTTPDLTQIARALAEHGGKVATTARALGMHRNQLRRLMARHNLRSRTE